MNTLLNAMKEAQNYTFTENGAITHKSTMSGLVDLFATGAAFRSRSDEDCILLFKKAFDEDPIYAMKCLFYLRDARGGQGERRFFRVVMKWLANTHTEAARRNLDYVPVYARWDDLYTFVDTPLESAAFDFMYCQLALDVQSATPSLLAKWLKSENSSSKETRTLGLKTRKAFNMTARQYRKTLSVLRERIRVLERLMSAGRWTDIEFDKIPSRAGLIYRNAFARHDIERMREGIQTYADFAKDETTTVNTEALYPCDIVHKALGSGGWYGGYDNDDSTDVERDTLNKYWNNLADYFQNAVFNGVAVVDTSASMWGGCSKIAPIDVACALGMYCAEKCNSSSPWYGHYISFSSQAQLVSIDGTDFVDKVRRIRNHNLCENTNIESVFNLLLTLAVENNIPQSEMPENIIVVSDMEFDQSRDSRARWDETVMEGVARKYLECGYQVPHLIFWCVESRNRNNIPMRDNGATTFISGYNPILFEQVLSGKAGLDFILDKLNSERYRNIR